MTGGATGTSHAASLRVDAKRYTKQRGSLLWTTGNPQHRVPHHIKWTSFAPLGWTNFAPPLTLLGQRQLGATHLVLDGSRLLVGDLGLQQLADDSLHRMLALEAVGEHLVERVAHAGELECGHHLQDLMALHGRPPSSGRSGCNRPPAQSEDAGSRASGSAPSRTAGADD